MDSESYSANREVHVKFGSSADMCVTPSLIQVPVRECSFATTLVLIGLLEKSPELKKLFAYSKCTSELLKIFFS